MTHSMFVHLMNLFKRCLLLNWSDPTQPESIKCVPNEDFFVNRTSFLYFFQHHLNDPGSSLQTGSLLSLMRASRMWSRASGASRERSVEEGGGVGGGRRIGGSPRSSAPARFAHGSRHSLRSRNSSFRAKWLTSLARFFPPSFYRQSGKAIADMIFSPCGYI